ncbi:MAG: DNA-3-methyladenine glycosylase family protein [Coriobacteriaceae bacterium]|jgi:N-glycosylase/DNA lyase
MRTFKTVVHFDGEFDAEKIINSGQCFRAVRLSPEQTASIADSLVYRFIDLDHVLYIRSVPDTESQYLVSCTAGEWNRIWHRYFDFDRNYEQIRRSIPADDTFLTKAARISRGLRVLKQDLFETLITFICSQRKSIPAIRSCVDTLALRYGSPHPTDLEPELHLFPTPEQLSAASEEDLRAAKLGYRAPYVRDAVEKVCSGQIDLQGLAQVPDDEMIEQLETIQGVGIKVASCVALFAYGRTALCPVDTWIGKIIKNYYGGVNPFPSYGDTAGIMQQYAFFVAVNRERAHLKKARP